MYPIGDGIDLAALLAGITVARCAGGARGARPSAVGRAILEKGFAVFAPRNRGDNGARPDSDRPANAITSTHYL
jgi:hypothetical protein